ncbi:MAG: 6-bladed beta-propeller [Gemmatimonadota bacterium]
MRKAPSGRSTVVRRRAPSLSLALLALGAGACGPPDDAALRDATSFEDSAGVALSMSGGPGWSAEAAWRLEPDLTIGEPDGELSFGRIASVAPADGEIYVLDRQSQVVRVFDDSGAYLREFGGEGDGPGELHGAAVLGPTTDGEVGVAATFPPVLHWFRRDGSYVRSLHLPTSGDEGWRGASFAIWHIAPSGLAFARVATLGFPPPEDGRVTVRVLRFALDGAVDTVVSWPEEVPVAVDGRQEEVRVLEPRIVIAMREDGSFLRSPGLPYAIERYDARGRLVGIIRRPVEPVPVTEEIRRRVVEEVRAAMEESGSPDAFIDGYVERLAFPSRLPAIFRLWVSEMDGRIWAGVVEGGAFRQDGNPTAWDVFDPNGRFLGRLPIPDGFRASTIREDAVYGVWKDELDVEYARRYRIVRPE